jgi:hypothetical protein
LIQNQIKDEEIDPFSYLIFLQSIGMKVKGRTIAVGTKIPVVAELFGSFWVLKFVK